MTKRAKPALRKRRAVPAAAPEGSEVIYTRVPPGTRARILSLPTGEHPSAWNRRHLMEALERDEARAEQTRAGHPPA